MKPWTKKDFEIKGRFTGSQLKGRENEYIYEIFFGNKQMGDYRFTSKAKANAWLGEFLRKANKLRRKYDDTGKETKV